MHLCIINIIKKAVADVSYKPLRSLLTSVKAFLKLLILLQGMCSFKFVQSIKTPLS